MSAKTFLRRLPVIRWLWALANVAGARALLAELQREAARLREEIGKTHNGVGLSQQDIRDVRVQLSAVGDEVQNCQRAIDDLRNSVRDLSDDLAPLTDRTSFLLRKSNLSEDKIVSLQGSIGLQQGKIAEARREIMFQQRRLTSLADRLDQPEALHPNAKLIVDQRMDSLYVALEDSLRGSHDDIKQRLEPYLDYVIRTGAGAVDRPILDIGCGRGEWLLLLKENHLNAYGIDVNTMMVERALALGLDARHCDLLDHFRQLPDQSLSAITAFHVVEHLPFDVLVDFLDEALRTLTPGGILILETPNPETMRVGATTFYNDPTHRNPITPILLEFLVGHRGFCDVEVERLHPYTHADKLHDDRRDSRHLNIVLFGPQDFAIIARRDVR
jgi:SAM-dependent methyltransferase